MRVGSGTPSVAGDSDTAATRPTSRAHFSVYDRQNACTACTHATRGCRRCRRSADRKQKNGPGTSAALPRCHCLQRLTGFPNPPSLSPTPEGMQRARRIVTVSARLGLRQIPRPRRSSSANRLLVGEADQLFGLGSLVGVLDAHLQVAGAEVADLPHVAAEVAACAERRVERKVEE